MVMKDENSEDNLEEVIGKSKANFRRNLKLIIIKQITSKYRA